MKVFSCLLAFLIVLFLISNPILAQQQNERAVMLWTARTQSTTNDILIDINKLDAADRAFFYARLGETWWEKDKNEAGNYFNKAVEYATSPATEYKDAQEKFQLLRDLLKTVASKDVKLEKKIIAALTEASEELSETDNTANSEAILKTARSIVDTDVQKAFNLGILTLRQKNPVFSFSSVLLFLKIRGKNETLANNYYAQALTVAQTKATGDFLDNLIGLAFPEVSVAVGEKPQWTQVSDELLRKRCLSILADYIKNEAEDSLEKKRTDCRTTSFYGIKLLNQYKLLLPEKAPVISQAINICQVSLEPKNKPDSTLDEKPKTIEELLELAQETEDKELKTKYLLDAAHLANKQKKYKLAVKILDDVGEDMRDKPPGVWEFNRQISTASLILELIENENLSETYDTFKKSPDVTRTFIKISVIDKLDPKKHKQLGYDLLNDVRKEFNKLDLKPMENVRVIVSDPTLFKYVAVLYDKFGFPNEAVETYQDSIKSLNRYIAQISSDRRKETVRLLPLNWSVYADFQSPLFENHFESIEQSISQIEFQPIRLNVRLQWLKNSLRRQTEIEKEMLKAKPKSNGKGASVSK